MSYQTLTLTINNHIAHIALNRPKKANALNKPAWDELKAVFEQVSGTPEARVVVLSGEGKHFCTGIDLGLLMSIRQETHDDCEGHMREKLRAMVFYLQAPINAVEMCHKPVLAAVHGACVGAGLDLVTACDMRYATEDAFLAHCPLEGEKDKGKRDQLR